MAKKHAMAAADENPFGSSVTDVAASIVNQMKGDGGTLSPTPSSSPTDRATSGAAAGCKPGMARQSYVMPVELPGKLKALAGHLGMSASSLATEILEKGIAEREEEFWARMAEGSFNVTRHFLQSIV